VIELGSDWIAQFSSAGVLSELPGDGNAVGHFLAWSLEPARWKGRTYAYPWSVDARALFVNVDLMKASHWGDSPITTLDDLLTMSDDVQKTGQTGFGANGDDAHRLYKKILPIMWTLDGDVFDANGTCVLNSPANVNALNLYASLARTGMVETQRMIDAAFVQGRVGAIFSGSWLMKKLKSAPFRWRALPMPGNGTTPGVQFAGGEYLALAASSPKKGLAKQLIAFLTAGKNSVRFCRQVDEAGFPADTAFTNDSALIADPTKAVFARQLRSARMTPVHPRWLDVEAILEHAVVQVLYGTQTAEEALADAQQQVESLRPQ
jgi:maltose-binding protein MalE